MFDNGCYCEILASPYYFDSYCMGFTVNDQGVYTAFPCDTNGDPLTSTSSSSSSTQETFSCDCSYTSKNNNLQANKPINAVFWDEGGDEITSYMYETIGYNYTQISASGSNSFSNSQKMTWIAAHQEGLRPDEKSGTYSASGSGSFSYSAGTDGGYTEADNNGLGLTKAPDGKFTKRELVVRNDNSGGLISYYFNVVDHVKATAYSTQAGAVLFLAKSWAYDSSGIPVQTNVSKYFGTAVLVAFTGVQKETRSWNNWGPTTTTITKSFKAYKTQASGNIANILTTSSSYSLSHLTRTSFDSLTYWALLGTTWVDSRADVVAHRVYGIGKGCTLYTPKLNPPQSGYIDDMFDAIVGPATTTISDYPVTFSKLPYFSTHSSSTNNVDNGDTYKSMGIALPSTSASFYHIKETKWGASCLTSITINTTCASVSESKAVGNFNYTGENSYINNIIVQSAGADIQVFNEQINFLKTSISQAGFSKPFTPNVTSSVITRGGRATYGGEGIRNESSPDGGPMSYFDASDNPVDALDSNYDWEIHEGGETMQWANENGMAVIDRVNLAIGSTFGAFNAYKQNFGWVVYGDSTFSGLGIDISEGPNTAQVPSFSFNTALIQSPNLFTPYTNLITYTSQKTTITISVIGDAVYKTEKSSTDTTSGETTGSSNISVFGTNYTQFIKEPMAFTPNLPLGVPKISDIVFIGGASPISSENITAVIPNGVFANTSFANDFSKADKSLSYTALLPANDKKRKIYYKQKLYLTSGINQVNFASVSFSPVYTPDNVVLTK